MPPPPSLVRGRDTVAGAGWYAISTCLYAATSLMFVLLHAERSPFLWLAYYEIGGIIGYVLVLLPHRQYLREHGRDIRDLVLSRKAFYRRHGLPVSSQMSLFGNRSFLAPYGGSIGFIFFAVATGIAPAAIVVAIRGSRVFFTTFAMSAKMAAYGYHVSRKHAWMLGVALLALSAIVLSDGDFWESDPLAQGSLALALLGFVLAGISVVLSLGDITLHKRMRLLIEQDIISTHTENGVSEREEQVLLPALMCSFLMFSVLTVSVCVSIVAAGWIFAGNVPFSEYSVLETVAIAVSGGIISPNAHLGNNRAVIRGRNLKIRVITFALPAVAIGYISLYAVFSDYEQNIVWWLFLAGLATMLSLSVLMFLTSSQSATKSKSRKRMASAQLKG